ncbi:MAG: DUF2252 domain-containing protein [Actinobacteria bacterium]|nr:DUF2252 domain-containing protein [Actinomycetota bacterium]
MTEVNERAAAGRAARSVARRSSHAEWTPPPNRHDPVAIIEAQDERRVADLVPIRHGRMAASPFTFYRGAAAVMAADLASTPASGFRVQTCGDAHLSNFGAFAAPDRRLVFDLNDFDETLPGPWEWDVKRLATSFALAGRDRGFKRAERSAALLASVRSYREAMREFAAIGDMEVWYARLDVEEQLGKVEAIDPGSVKRFERGIAKARAKDSVRAMEKLTEVVDGELRIVSQPPLVVPIEELVPPALAANLEASLREVIAAYRATLPGDRQHLLDGYEFRRIARKVVGVGSVGTRAWVILMTGRDDEDPLFLQAKEAEASVLEPFAGPSHFRNHGRRVVEGQRMMQAAGDIFLGWCMVNGLDGSDRDFYVRQLWDWKRSVEVENLSPVGLQAYANVCGWTLARAHARSGDRIGIASYLGGGDNFDRAVCHFAESYADQSERDHAALVAAIDSGRLEAVKDV